MSPHPPQRLLSIDSRGDVAVARFPPGAVLSGERAEAAGAELAELATGTACPRLLLDFGNVTSVSSLTIGMLLTLHKQVHAAGGRLALCRVSPVIHDIFQLVKLTQLIPVYGDEEEALRSF